MAVIVAYTLKMCF